MSTQRLSPDATSKPHAVPDSHSWLGANVLNGRPMQVEVSVTRGTHTDVTGTKACESIPGQYASGAQNGARFGPRAARLADDRLRATDGRVGGAAGRRAVRASAEAHADVAAAGVGVLVDRQLALDDARVDGEPRGARLAFAGDGLTVEVVVAAVQLVTLHHVAAPARATARNARLRALTAGALVGRQDEHLLDIAGAGGVGCSLRRGSRGQRSSAGRRRCRSRCRACTPRRRSTARRAPRSARIGRRRSSAAAGARRATSLRRSAQRWRDGQSRSVVQASPVVAVLTKAASQASRARSHTRLSQGASAMAQRHWPAALGVVGRA
jgi:hypothetical protein